MSSAELNPAGRPSPAGTEVAADHRAGEDTRADGDIGWARAIASGLVVLLVGFVHDPFFVVNFLTDRRVE